MGGEVRKCVSCLSPHSHSQGSAGQAARHRRCARRLQLKNVTGLSYKIGGQRTHDGLDKGSHALQCGDEAPRTNA